MLFFFWAAGPQNADARPPKAFLYYGDLTQWLDLRYDYSGNAPDDGGYRSQHLFKEQYHVGLSYSLINPNFFTGTAALDLGLRQKTTTGDYPDKDGGGGGSIAGYELTGNLWKTRPYSAGFRLQASEERIDQSDYDSYDLDTDLRSAYLTWKNRFLPIKFSFIDSESKTSGLVTDRETGNSQFALMGVFTQPYLGETRFDLRHEDQNTSFSSGANDFERKSDYAAINNLLTFIGVRQRGRLLSSWTNRDESGTRPFRSTQWGESLSYSPGKAMDLTLDYTRYTLTTEDEGFENQDLERDDWRASLRHHLYESLTTYVDVQHTNEENTQGDRNYTEGRLTLAYTKLLPDDARLTLTTSKLWALTEQDYADPQAVFTAEIITVAAPAIPFPLKAANIREETIQVIDAQTGIPYEEGTDYLVISEGSRTLLYVGDSLLIDVGTSLRIEYAYEADPYLEYFTDGLIIGSSLSLYNNKMNIYATFTKNDYEIYEGESFYTFDPYTSYIFGFDARLPKLNFGGFFTYSDSDREDRKSIEGYVNINKKLPRGYITINIHDSFTNTKTENPDINSTNDSSNNYFLIDADYNTVIFRQTKAKVYGKYRNIQSDAQDRNDVLAGVRLTYKTRWLVLDLDGYLRWRFAESESTREDVLYMHIRRMF